VQKHNDKDKLLKLIDEFSAITSIEELACIVYITIQMHRGRFSYECEDFEDFSPIGPISRKLFEDVFHLEVREKLIARGSRMMLTSKGKERISLLGEEISFSDVKELLSSLDKDLWPKLVAYFYLRHKYSAKEAMRILKRSYDVDNRSQEILSELVKKLAP